VLVNVAAIFRPMFPDFPIPTTTIFARRRSVSTASSTATLNDEPNNARTLLNAAISTSNTCWPRLR